jgi:hypothetical protein
VTDVTPETPAVSGLLNLPRAPGRREETGDAELDTSHLLPSQIASSWGQRLHIRVLSWEKQPHLSMPAMSHTHATTQPHTRVGVRAQASSASSVAQQIAIAPGAGRLGDSLRNKEPHQPSTSHSRARIVPLLPTIDTPSNPKLGPTSISTPQACGAGEQTHIYPPSPPKERFEGARARRLAGPPSDTITVNHHDQMTLSEPSRCLCQCPG